MEEIEFNILFCWFEGLGLDAPVWDHSTFTKNPNRLLESDIAKLFFVKVVERAKRKNLLTDEHFTVDRSLIEAWASMKSFKPKDGADGKDGTVGGGAIPKSVSVTRRVAMILMSERQTRMRGYIRSQMGPNPSSRISGMCSWKATTGSRWMSRCRLPRERRSGTPRSRYQAGSTGENIGRSALTRDMTHWP